MRDMKLKNVLLLFSLFIYSTFIYAYIEQELSNKITHMIKTNLPDATVGVTVQSVDTGEILYDYHGAKNFLPASTTKLFTAAAALKTLGPDFRFETSLYYFPNSVEVDVHNNDVALQFRGDPSLQLASLYSLLQKLSFANIKTINGNIIIDDTIFSGPNWALGWTHDSTSWHHAAPVAAVIIDRNQFGVTLLPPAQVDDKVNAQMETKYPGSKFIALTSDIRAVTYEDSETLCQLTADVDDNNNVALGGCWPVGSEPVHLRLAIKNPRLQAEKLILEALQKLDIQLVGKIVFAPIRSGMVKVAHHSSEPLYTLLKPILNDSNNLYAESLIKTLGAGMHGTGSFKTGSSAVQKILTDTTGIDFTSIRLQDGSGESRYNLITPRHLASLLYSMHHEPLLANHFRNALAISGMDGTGTLKNRFVKNISEVRAKTGSIKGVSTLAGYFTSYSNREIIIAVMINQALENNVLLREFEDSLCYLLMEQM